MQAHIRQSTEEGPADVDATLLELKAPFAKEAEGRARAERAALC